MQLTGGFGAALVTRSKRCMVCTDVPRLQSDDPQVEKLLAEGKPVVITGSPLCAALAHWNVEHLSHAQPEDCPTWPVHFTPRAVRRVNRTYGANLGEGGVREMTMESFATTPVDGPFNHYLQALLTWSRGGGATRASADAEQASTARELRPGLGATLERELNEGVDWAWLRTASAAAGEGAFEACQLWLSLHGRPIHTPCHYDGAANFIAQLCGAKRFTLFAPRESFRLYPFPVGHPLDNFAMADVDSWRAHGRADARCPALAAAPAMSATLTAGDVLYLPRYWWHHVEQLAPAASSAPTTSNAPASSSADGTSTLAHATDNLSTDNLSLNFWLGSGVATLQPYEWLSMRGPTAKPRRVETFWCAEIEGGAARVREEVSALLHADTGADDADADAISDSEDDDTLFALVGGGSAAAIRCLHAARMTECGAFAVCGGRELGGRLLSALAVGADATWPADGAARAFADKVRAELVDVLLGTDGGDAGALKASSECDHGGSAHGGVAARLLLRIMTRDGRLNPGLAPPVPDEYVASERGDVTPAEEVARLEREVAEVELA